MVENLDRAQQVCCLCSAMSGPQQGRFSGWGLESSEDVFTHLPGAWVGRAWRVGLLTGAPTMAFLCCLASSEHGGLGVAMIHKVKAALPFMSHP